METTSIIKEIENAHSMSNFALRNKDFTSFIGYFSDNLKYKQLNSKTIDKNQLSKDTLQYFNRIQSCTTNYDRLNFPLDNDLFTETLVQKATVSIRVFIFFSKRWTAERNGIYKWRKENGKWKIVDVEITSEKIT